MKHLSLDLETYSMANEAFYTFLYDAFSCMEKVFVWRSSNKEKP